MKKIISFTLFCCASLSVAAQQASSKPFEIKAVQKNSQIPSFVVFAPGAPADVKDPDRWFVTNMGANTTFHLTQSSYNKDAAGNLHYKFSQSYKGIPVEGAVINIHCKKNLPANFNGVFYPQLSANIKPSINESKALSIALEQFSGASFAWQNPAYEKMIAKVSKGKQTTYFPKASMFIVPLVKAGESPKYRLAYQFNIYAIAPMRRRMIYVDALDGSVLFSKELLHDVAAIGTAHTKYSGIQNITTDKVAGDTFFLQEEVDGVTLATLNGKNFIKETFSGDIVDFVDNDNDWNNVNADMDEVATDLHFGIEKTYDFYKKVFLRNSVDDAGHYMYGVAHIADSGRKYANAFWNGNFFMCGDGNDTSINPLTSLDVVGHELTHGVTQFSAGLTYMNESGALNESFSDIFGKTIEQKYKPLTFSWIIGKEIMKPGKIALRDMQHPNNMEDPKYYKGLYYYIGPKDNGGVHTNSGVQNYWYYLLCAGDTGTRESDSQPFEVKKIGMDKASLIAYNTLTNFLTSSSEYEDAARYSIEAAKSLYGDSTFEVFNVEMAWYAVGLWDKPTWRIKDTPPASIQALAPEIRITVFPNPTIGTLIISAPRSFDNASVALYNVAGQLLSTKEHQSGSTITFDLTAQPAGIYFLDVNNEAAVQRIKVVKE